MPEAVLVTGATGFIGSALCRALAAEGHPVRALHRAASSVAALNGLPVERVLGDILLPETLGPALRGVAWVFHAAAVSAYWRQPATQVVAAAVQGTRNIVAAARAAGARRVILTSSLAAMGLPRRGELLDESHTFNLQPRQFPYGYAKRQAELEALTAAGPDVEVVILNPAVVLGPGDVNQISGSLVVEAARGRTFAYTDGGVNVVHIDDVIAGHLAGARLGRPGQRYILGGENLTHRQIFTALAEIVGRPGPRIRIPDWAIGPLAAGIDLIRLAAPLPLDGTQLRLSRCYLYVDGAKARRELGVPAPRPFRQAAREAYDWYRRAGVIG